MDRIYLDNAATTACAPEVLEAMLPYFTQTLGNASSIHAFGRDSKRAVEAARRQVMKALNAAAPQEIIFTGGGSESDNWAIKGAALARGDGTSSPPPSSITRCCTPASGWKRRASR